MKTAIIGLPMVGKTSLFTILTGVHQESRIGSTAVRAGVSSTIVPVGLPDEFLAAGALPTLHERYGLSTDRVVATVLANLR